MRATVDAACAIEADAVIFHIGSHLGAGFETGLARVVPAVEQVLERCNDRTWLLMENSAGAGGTVGRSLDELAVIFEALDRHERLGICLDSCHLWVSGIDVTDPVAFDELLDEDWDRQLAVDLRAAYHCSKAAVPHMRAAGGGRIVNFADWIAVSRRPRYTGFVPYYVAKSGVVALSEALALELAPDQILVNTVAPGPILPPPETSDDERTAVARATPLGRWGGGDEIVKAFLFLIDTNFVTGETIRVDGGRHLK